MMTLTEVFAEINACEAKVEQLRREVMEETDKSVAMAKIDEMMALAKRAYELDTLHKSLLKAKLAFEQEKMKQRLKEMRKKAL